MHGFRSKSNASDMQINIICNILFAPGGANEKKKKKKKEEEKVICTKLLRHLISCVP